MNVIKKFIVILFTALFFVTATTASAHVVVKPDSVGVAQRVNFTVSVPTEKEIPTVKVRLLIPEGLRNVRPLVKPDWDIELVKEETEVGSEESGVVTEIIWTGGSIPLDHKDEFAFSAQAPDTEDQLIWKAYQTYSDGTVVAWEINPNENLTDFSESGPYSTTTVVDDLTNKGTFSTWLTSEKAFSFSLASLVISTISLVLVLSRKRK